MEKMSKKERFISTIMRESVDRPAWWSGLPVTNAFDGLMRYYGVSDEKEYKIAVDDDLWPIEFPYKSETSNAIYAAFDFAKKIESGDSFERTLTSPGFFEDYEDESAIELFNWPDPEKYISKDECISLVNDVPAGYPILGMVWSAHFQDACAAFGMEDALIKMKMCPELFSGVINKIVDFYIRANEIFYEYTLGKIDAVIIGNDFGTQTGLLTSPDDLRKYVFDGTKKLIQQAHSYGIKVIHHSCGAIDSIIPDLIDLGVDAIHPIQALASGMNPENLKERFGGLVSFCGGVDAQYLLVNGSTGQVEEKVEYLCKLFPTGLIVSPSHEAILSDVNPANINAIRNAILKAGK